MKFLVRGQPIGDRNGLHFGQDQFHLGKVACNVVGHGRNPKPLTGHLPTDKTTVAQNPQIGLRDGQPPVFEEIQQLIVFANANEVRRFYVFQGSDLAVAFKVRLAGVNAPFGFADFAAD